MDAIENGDRRKQERQQETAFGGCCFRLDSRFRGNDMRKKISSGISERKRRKRRKRRIKKEPQRPACGRQAQRRREERMFKKKIYSHRGHRGRRGVK